ncbi:MAG TPA: ACP S-malonyltransferase [Solirubrobacterales bacterium]|nr:ACP S-malonyltransferase [Solirubrobacterales bacterium]
MDETTAILFPGQGSHAGGMRELVERHEPELATIAVEEVGEDPFARAGEATRFAQPAILAASLASWRRAGSPAGAYFAGHSLGELSALAAAGAIDHPDALRLAVQRGRLMDEAARRSPGGMVALLGDREVAAEVAVATGLVLANDNGPTQTVLAAPADKLADAEAAAKGRGLRAMRLPVAGAFHSEAMAPAVEPFREALAAVEIGAPRVPVISCASARPFGEPPEIREQLAAALVQPVRWGETLAYLHRAGVRSFLESGPGRTLTGMVRRALDGVVASVLEPWEETAHV